MFTGFKCFHLYLWAVTRVKKGNASPRIHPSNCQFQSRRPAIGSGCWDNDTQWYHITCNSGTLSAPFIEHHFADMLVFSHFRCSGHVVQHVWQPDWYGGLTSKLCVWNNFYLIGFVCVLYALPATGSGVTYTILNFKGVGFLPGRVWLASCIYCYQVTLITNSSILPAALGGWLVG